MKNSKISQSGYVEGINNKVYIFTYDGELLRLIPQDKSSIKHYDFLQNKNQFFEVMKATNIKGENIVFLKCELCVSLSGYIAKPSGYICFYDGTSEFETITFRGKTVNYFYRPNHIIDDEQTKYDYENGGGNIRLKSFDENSQKYEVIIDGKKADMLLGVTQPEEPKWMQEEYTLGRPQSILRLEFEELIKVENFTNVYMWIYKFLVFLNFRSNIDFGDIYLGKWSKNREIRKIADVYLTNTKEYELVDVDNTIGYFFIQDKMAELLNIINEKNLNLLFIPNSRKESMKIDPQKYIMCCTSFESVFNFCFPNAKIEDQEKAKEVKKEFLGYIESRREAYKGMDGKKRKEFKKYADIIQLLDFGLAEKVQYCIDKYKEYLCEYMNQIYTRFGIADEEKNDMVTAFAEKRNMLIHSNLVEFEKIHIAAYLIVRAIIYVMILDSVGVKRNLIIQALDKIL